MSGSISSSAGCRYGLARVCSAWAFPRSTFYAQAAPPADPLAPAAPPPAKRGPKPPLADAALLALIRADLAASVNDNYFSLPATTIIPYWTGGFFGVGRWCGFAPGWWSGARRAQPAWR